MNTLVALLPLYLLGNLHCLGMCGPLVMWLGRHPYRYWYFLGRTLSFTLAGFMAGMLGWVFQIELAQYHFTALASLGLGVGLAIAGSRYFIPWKFSFSNPLRRRLGKLTASISMQLAGLMEQEQRWPSFWFGFCTILLPCGQTLVVYSSCAVAGEPFWGFFNGCIFALLTSPSLLVAMHSGRRLAAARFYYLPLMGLAFFAASALTLLRALADLQCIPHCRLGAHLVIF